MASGSLKVVDTSNLQLDLGRQSASAVSDLNRLVSEPSSVVSVSGSSVSHCPGTDYYLVASFNACYQGGYGVLSIQLATTYTAPIKLYLRRCWGNPDDWGSWVQVK